MLDLSRPLRLHLLPIGGSGIGPLASILARMGHHVSGCDQVPSARLEGLAAQGIEVAVGHDPAHLLGADAVVASAAIPEGEPELVAARRRGLAVVSRRSALAALCHQRRTLAVGGTHGKTTTTALLATVLRQAGMAPSFLVGGDVPGLGGASWDGGEWFVVEADESDGTFLDLGAEAVIVTSVEPDHLDHHGDLRGLHDAFDRFVRQAPGSRIVCSDDPGAAELARHVECLTYGTAPGARFRLAEVELGRSATAFTLSDGGTEVARLQVPVPGLHNARNAAAAAVAALCLGAAVADVVAGVASFAGVARRFEMRGHAGGITFVDSYDHLPGEVAAALAAARDGAWDRIVCVFQPHRYTRTAALWQEFGHSFDGADLLAVTEIYPAGQRPIPGVSGKLIVDAALDARPGRRVAWLPGRDDVTRWLLAELRPGDLCLTLGAGDLTTLPGEVMAALAATPGAGGR
ncbi:MAG TPA: UDP-N-acetylmuramate--L-alanine ligase [Acidimicrobiales bacterium]|nr:UDP-N-acetylmuramate--L-alanine ligase [Acidimicrobiales bacterium]